MSAEKLRKHKERAGNAPRKVRVQAKLESQTPPTKKESTEESGAVEE
jgi:hypothetical protein